MELTNEKIRRKDRVMSDEESLKLLREAEYGVLSINSENGAYGVPVNYAWDGGSKIYFHGAKAGRKLDLIEKNKNVSFCIVGKTKILREKAGEKQSPCFLSTAYESVILQGTMELDLSDEERMHGLGIIINKFSDGMFTDAKAVNEKMFNAVKIIGMNIESMTGKSRRE